MDSRGISADGSYSETPMPYKLTMFLDVIIQNGSSIMLVF